MGPASRVRYAVLLTVVIPGNEMKLIAALHFQTSWFRHNH
jgi:hypothetical protein